MGRKFLIIDDSALMRRVISDIIKLNSEYEVLDTAVDGVDGLDKLVAHPGYYDLVILDINMPKMNGLEMLEMLQKLKKGDIIPISEFFVKEGKTSPPKRYNSGSIILAMENAGQLIEDEELRAQIKGSGIGTSATRAEILKKLIDKGYIKLNNKTQIITPTLLGEMIYDVVAASIKYLLDPTLTASWEKGLTGVADATISCDEYLEKLEGFVTRRTLAVKQVNNQYMLRPYFDYAAAYYK